MFRVENYLLKKFLDRWVSFLRQETHEHVKTIEKRCLEAKHDIFRKNAFRKRYVFLMVSSDFHISDPKLTF